MFTRFTDAENTNLAFNKQQKEIAERNLEKAKSLNKPVKFVKPELSMDMKSYIDMTDIEKQSKLVKKQS